MNCVRCGGGGVMHSVDAGKNVPASVTTYPCPECAARNVTSPKFGDDGSSVIPRELVDEGEYPDPEDWVGIF